MVNWQAEDRRTVQWPHFVPWQQVCCNNPYPQGESWFSSQLQDSHHSWYPWCTHQISSQTHLSRRQTVHKVPFIVPRYWQTQKWGSETEHQPNGQACCTTRQKDSFPCPSKSWRGTKWNGTKRNHWMRAWSHSMVVASCNYTKEELRVLRVRINMRMENRAVIRDRHLMPTVDDLVHTLNGGTVFSKLDLRAGYHQLSVSPACRYITTFATNKGLWRHTWLNFGTNSANEIFQKIIQDQLRDIPGSFNISDDVIVFGKAQADYDATLEAVCQRFADDNLTLNKKKCEFNKSAVTFFGFCSQKKGLHQTPQKWKLSKMHQHLPLPVVSAASSVWPHTVPSLCLDLLMFQHLWESSKWNTPYSTSPIDMRSHFRRSRTSLAVRKSWHTSTQKGDWTHYWCFPQLDCQQF